VRVVAKAVGLAEDIEKARDLIDGVELLQEEERP
jgi:hypothetical protein